MQPTGPVTLRPAAATEHEALEALQWRASLHNPGDREALLAHADANELPLQQIVDGSVFVAEVAGNITGFAAVAPRDDGDAELDALFVEPAAWRRGVGRALVEHAAELARARGAGALHVIGNPHAQGFYLACGFELLATRPMRFGVGLVMRRPLR